MMLSEFDITYVTQKSIKDQAIADYLAWNPLDESNPMYYDFPDEEVLCLEVKMTKCDRWKIYFDGASNQAGNGIRAALISPIEDHIPIAIKLQFECTNNIVEYEGLVLSLRQTQDLKVKVLAMYGYLELIFN